MKAYKVLSVLLCYPEQELLDSLPAIKQILSELAVYPTQLTPLLNELASNDLIDLQENYVQTFDRTPSHSLHLFEHIHGEDRLRGQALVDLMNEYKKTGFEMLTEELPDYLPLFLEYLAVCDANKAKELLGDAIDIIGHIGTKLTANQSVYSGVFHYLETLSPIKAQPLITPPIRDMDEALEKFGPSLEGIEPLLQLNSANACVTCESSTRHAK